MPREHVHLLNAEEWIVAQRQGVAILAQADPVVGVGQPGGKKRGCAPTAAGQPVDDVLRAKSYILAAAKRNLDQQPWQRWIYEGRLHRCENVIAQLKDDLLSTSETIGVASVAYDPHNALQLGLELNEAGLKSIPMPQNCGQYNEPVREFLNALADGRMTHDGDELLSWCVLNMALFTNRKGEWMPDKKHSKEKIDTAVACLMAFREAYFAAGGNNWYYSSGSVEVG